MLYGLPLTDNIPPAFKKIALYPIGLQSQVRNSSEPFIADPSGDRSSFNINGEKTIPVYGTIGFGVEIYDYLNGSPNRCGIYSIELFVDGKRVYYSKMDEFSFSESRFINAHIDYALKQEKNINIQHLYKLPYNELSIYKYIQNNGLVEITDTLFHEIKISATDANGNSSSLEFRLKGTETPQVKKENKEFYGKILPFNMESGFSEKDIELAFPSFCFYNDVSFTYSRTKGRDVFLSDIFQLHNENTPVHKQFKLSLAPTEIPSLNADKYCIVKIEKDDQLSYVGGLYENGMMTAQVRNFGNFAITMDTLAPTIKPMNLHSGKDLSEQPGISFAVNDDLSGIKSYNGYIDNQWVLFEYDPKNDLISYEFDQRVPISKKNHEIEIYLIDVQGNTNVYHTSFYR